MAANDKVNVLLVDDQPAKLLAYEVILKELGENLLMAASAREALDHLLKTDVAIVLIDVCMPELDGFQLASMIREHPRFERTSIIFVSAIHLTDMDRLRGYEMGAVDYVPVPVVPEVLRAKVKVFAELYRKTRQLEHLNVELERRVSERTARAGGIQRPSAGKRAAPQPGAGSRARWAPGTGTSSPASASGTRANTAFSGCSRATAICISTASASISIRRISPASRRSSQAGDKDKPNFQTEVRITRPDGQMRWCICAAALTTNAQGRVLRASGVTIDITDLKQAEERRTLLIREVDHRARNALAVVQSIVRLTKAKTIDNYVRAVEGRIRALSTAHVLLSESRWEGADLSGLVDEELAPYKTGEAERIFVEGPAVFLQPSTAQILALVLHELATNAAKYGALSNTSGSVRLSWRLEQGELQLEWQETGGPTVAAPALRGYGTKVITESVERQLGGTAKFDWRAGGLRFTMSITFAPGSRATKSNFGRQASADASSERPTMLPGNRLLLVEDEALVGMMMKDTLTELGFDVVGPYNTMKAATAAVHSEHFDGAILDVNLAGELVYPLADVMAQRGVPFVFVTGYGADGIDRRYSDVPILQKPIERQKLQSIFHVHQNGSGQPHAAARRGVPVTDLRSMPHSPAEFGPTT